MDQSLSTKSRFLLISTGYIWLFKQAHSCYQGLQYLKYQILALIIIQYFLFSSFYPYFFPVTFFPLIFSFRTIFSFTRTLYISIFLLQYFRGITTKTSVTVFYPQYPPTKCFLIFIEIWSIFQSKVILRAFYQFLCINFLIHSYQSKIVFNLEFLLTFCFCTMSINFSSHLPSISSFWPFSTIMLWFLQFNHLEPSFK